MSPEHYVRPEDESEGPSRDEARPRRGLGRILYHFFFEKEPPRDAPKSYPFRGFNANGRRHS
jgi:hypothetical protein